MEGWKKRKTNSTPTASSQKIKPSSTPTVIPSSTPTLIPSSTPTLIPSSTPAKRRSRIVGCVISNCGALLLILVVLICIQFLEVPTTVITETPKPVKKEQINEIVTTHLSSQGDIDTKQFSQQLYSALLTYNEQKALTIHLLGTTDNMMPLKETCNHLAKVLFGTENPLQFFTELKGNEDPQTFLENIVNKVNLEGKCPSHIFLIDADELTQENRDILEGAFDDSAPFVLHSNQLVPTKCGIFVLISEISQEVKSAEGNKEKQGLLREEMTKKWTGRFYQRVRHIIGI